MKHVRKVLRSSFISLCILSLLSVSVLAFTSCKPVREESAAGDTYDQSIEIVNKTYPAKIIVYGEPILFRNGLKYFPTDTLTEDLFSDDGGKYERVVLVINDKNGTASLSPETIQMISSYVGAGELDFYYFGTDKIGSFQQYDIWKGNVSEADSSIVTILYEHTLTHMKGVWTAYDEKMNDLREESFGMIIIIQIADCLKSNH